MILDIVQYGDPILRKKCKSVECVNEEILSLVENMLETMDDANGVGLAAPQVGVDLQLAVVDVSHDPECISYLKVGGQSAELESIMPLVFINPVLELLPPHELDQEGCLSIQDLRAKVKRPTVVKATLPQLDGSSLEVETDGLLARAIQHEVDHLNGILFTDRLTPASKVRVSARLKRLLKPSY